MFNAIEIIDVKLEIGSFIRSIRKKRKLTQVEIAKTINVSRNTIQNLESGKNFTVNTLFKVLKEFDLLNDLHREILRNKSETKESKPLY